MIRWSIVIRTVTLSVCFSSSVAKDSYHIAKLGNLVTISPTEIVDDLGMCHRSDVISVLVHTPFSIRLSCCSWVGIILSATDSKTLVCIL